jgi:hypothetical protein
MKITTSIFRMLLIVISLSSIHVGIVLSHTFQPVLSEQKANIPIEQIKNLSSPENVPFMPGVQSQSVMTGINPPSKTLLLSTSDDYTKVLKFYEDYLLTHGWTPTRKGIYPIYQWKDTTGSMSWGLILSIRTIPQDEGGTDAEVYIRRWPNSEKLPFHPSASNLEVASIESVDGSTTTTTIMYETDASRDEVEEYYIVELPSAGWLFDAGEGNKRRTPLSLVFYTYYGHSMEMSITTQEAKNGKTIVTMTLSDYGPFNP